jgi:hypothetical protein
MPDDQTAAPSTGLISRADYAHVAERDRSIVPADAVARIVSDVARWFQLYGLSDRCLTRELVLVLEILLSESDRALALTGARCVGDLDASFVTPAPWGSDPR